MIRLTHSVLKGLGAQVLVDGVIDISFGFEVSLSAVLTAFMEVLMESSFVLVTCVWCEVAFLRSLAG